ncbi:hypothetical protein I316_02348 [Kwoniella heveanensis BCC8398]|uniref:Beta-galactosidase trimerisation domain-containing protein n=1 Tax=Kwoniella heveanensis BCC8398 TaxID=1296120 RepID=A0A1B9GY22_9TREE|nr:hypothetical protein I316_02348 [Kwoniella heveanensis BCC8398]
MTIAAPMTNGEATKWFHKPFSMYQTNLREIDADMDVEKAAQFISDYGVHAWLFGVGGIQAQYPTSLSFQEINPNLTKRASGDLVGDAIKVAKAKGLKILARMDFSKVAPRVADEHPDWLYRSPKGDLQTHTADLVSVCPSGEYYQERMFDIINEVCERYDLDGFFFNWMSMNEIDYDQVYHGVCHCGNCEKRWADFNKGSEHASTPLPNGPDDEAYPRWVVFSEEVIDDVIGRIRGFIAARKPNAGLILGQTADIMFHEANNAVGRELWHSATSEWVGSWKSFRPSVPAIANSTTFIDMPYRMAPENPEHFAQYLVQCISRGGNPSTYSMGTPLRIPYTCYDYGREITRFHRKWINVYDGLTPVAKTGLVRPGRTLLVAQKYNEAVKEFRGLYSAMKERHIPFDVLPQERLQDMESNGSLARYQRIIFGDIGRFAPGDGTVLDEWVAAGGKLLLTGSSGVNVDNSTQLESHPASRLISVLEDRRKLFNTYIAPEDSVDKTDPHTYHGFIAPIYGAHQHFELKSDRQIETYAKVLDRAPFAPPEYAYGNKAHPDEGGAVIAAFGQGTTAIIPFTIGRAYKDLGLTPLRDFFLDVLTNKLSAPEILSFDIAEQVEITVNRNGKDLIVHLDNQSGARPTNFGPYLPIAGGKITINGAQSSSSITAHALYADQEVQVKSGEIVLPVLGLFEVVVIKGVL